MSLRHGQVQFYLIAIGPHQQGYLVPALTIGKDIRKRPGRQHVAIAKQRRRGVGAFGGPHWSQHLGGTKTAHEFQQPGAGEALQGLLRVRRILAGGGFLQPGKEQVCRAVAVPRLGVRRAMLRPRQAEGPGIATLDDGAVEQALGQRGGQQAVDVPRPGGLTENRHTPGISAEGIDIALHPLQRCHHVQQRKIARAVLGRGPRLAQRPVAEPPQGSEAILDRHHDHPLLLHEGGAVIGQGGTLGVPATVNEDHHRQVRAGGNLRRCKHVEEQAVFAADERPRLHAGQTQAIGKLGTGGSKLRRGARVQPGTWFARCAPAQLPLWGLGVGNAEPDLRARGTDTSHHRPGIGVAKGPRFCNQGQRVLVGTVLPAQIKARDHKHHTNYENRPAHGRNSSGS